MRIIVASSWRLFAQRRLPYLLATAVLSVPILILWHMFVFPIGLVHSLFGDVIEFFEIHIWQ